MSTFGSGDYGGYNDWTFSQGSFYTNWNTTQYNPGALGRVQALGARWDAYSGLAPGTCSARNVLWRASTNLNATQTGVLSGTPRSAGTTATMHSADCTDLWVTGLVNYYLGFSAGSGDSHIFSWKDGSNGGYSGKSASSANNTGGTANWGGTTNGGLPVFGTLTISKVYVRRAGAWVRTFVYVRRSGVWTGPVVVKVRRSGVWTTINQVKEYEMPKNGEEILIDIGDGLERGWIIEEGEKSWFGSEDPTTQSWDWTKTGDYDWECKSWTGKYNSFESDELADYRLEARYKWDQALRWENYKESSIWYPKWQSDNISTDEVETLVPEMVA